MRTSYKQTLYFFFFFFFDVGSFHIIYWECVHPLNQRRDRSKVVAVRRRRAEVGEESRPPSEKAESLNDGLRPKPHGGQGQVAEGGDWWTLSRQYHTVGGVRGRCPRWLAKCSRRSTRNFPLVLPFFIHNQLPAQQGGRSHRRPMGSVSTAHA